MKVIKTLLCIVVLLTCKHNIIAQDSLKLTIEQAEKQFLENNLQLLAERFNIGIADAAIVQAKVLNNPTISVGDINLWHPNAAEELELLPATFGNRAVFSVELEQMVRTAGKRRKLINLERVSREIAIQEFEAFLWGLKTELRTILNEIIFMQAYRNVIKIQETSISDLVEIYKKQTAQGNIARSELIRLQASLIELEAEGHEIRTELNKQYKELKILLNIAPQTAIEILPSAISIKNPNDISLADLLETAKNSHPEFLLSDLEIQYNEKMLAYEKSLRMPDIGLSINYDRYGGVWRNFVGVGISFDLPVFDRNQGNIRMARLGIEQATHNANLQRNTLLQEIVEIYNNYVVNYRFYQRITANDFSEDLEQMLEVYARNLLNRNISMLEYLDFMDAYRTTKQAILTAKKNVNTSFAELQFLITKQ